MYIQIYENWPIENYQNSRSVTTLNEMYLINETSGTLFRSCINQWFVISVSWNFTDFETVPVYESEGMSHFYLCLLCINFLVSFKVRDLQFLLKGTTNHFGQWTPCQICIWYSRLWLLLSQPSLLMLSLLCCIFCIGENRIHFIFNIRFGKNVFFNI